MAMNIKSTLAHKVRQLYSNLLPIPCLVCGMPSSSSVICLACRHDLPRPDAACKRCAMPLTQHGTCGKCLTHPLQHDFSYSPFIYKAAIPDLISQFKYKHQFALTAFFAEQLILHRGDERLPHCLIPVPLHVKQLKRRGYNQSHELTKAISKLMGVPISHPIVRHNWTESQTGLSATQRKRNVQHAFKLVDEHLPAHIAVIDDVLTSGETANAITLLLRKAGVKTIELWTIARTIHHD
jgi:ComF family protein